MLNDDKSNEQSEFDLLTLNYYTTNMRPKQYKRNVTKDTFWEHVNKTDSCWEWTARLDRDGYGISYYDYKQYRAHRFSLMLAGVDIKGKVVCHKCDNRKCVNPEHLFVGTLADNVKDMVSKDRQWKSSTHGPRKPRTCRITEADKIAMANSTKPVAELAKEYSVHKTYIYRIRRARTLTSI